MQAFEFENENEEQIQYCEMVKLNMKDSSRGWPDFNGNYKEVCKDKEKWANGMNVMSNLRANWKRLWKF